MIGTDVSYVLTRQPTDFRPPADGAGVRLGSRAVGAAFDPRDGTVLVALQDLDRVLAGVVRIDPIALQVLERWRFPGGASRARDPLCCGAKTMRADPLRQRDS